MRAFVIYVDDEAVADGLEFDASLGLEFVNIDDEITDRLASLFRLCVGDETFVAVREHRCVARRNEDGSYRAVLGEPVE